MNEKAKIPFAAEYKATEPVSTVRKDYRLSRKDFDGTAELVEVGETDFREMVQSNYESSFDFILNRFLNDGELPGTDAACHEDQNFLLDALDVSMEYVEMMEEAREMYGLSSELTYSEIRDQLQAKLEEIKNTNLQGGVSSEETQTQRPDSASQSVEPETVEQVVS
uniref:Uncharacterized protein n=1 Tax=Dulem virus 80 TaxID=3145791 RepID=A0AAU8AW43_9VIRU